MTAPDPIARPGGLTSVSRVGRQARLTLALRIALRAIYEGHEVCCGGLRGNVFDQAMRDIEALTGLRPGEPGPQIVIPSSMLDAAAAERKQEATRWE